MIVIRKRYRVVVVAMIGVTALWGAVRYFGRSSAEAMQVQAGERATLHFFRDPAPVPAFTARDLDGRLVSSADWRGKVALVYFWATWCGPCRAEIPDLISLQEKYRDRLVILGVSVDEGSSAQVKRFVAEYRINYPVVMATPALDKIFPRSAAIPTVFVLDRETRVAQRHVGLIPPAITEMEIRALAGLPVNASIEQIERTQGLKLENAAQATTIPGVDLTVLTPDRRMLALQKLNSQPCTCGCELTVAKCRVDDPSCGTSLPLARAIVDQIARQP